ncbi:translation initiation factor IF-2 [Sulfurimonas sp. HSL-1656]|uniref:translation initiation factor IF-2 n=1 Tax=Thiomicrolovo subterrani TaxID=3131934 RepID=UPI0031F9E523
MSDKVRVSEIAKELGIASKEVVEKAQAMGLDSVKTASNSVSMEEAEKIANFIMSGTTPAAPEPKVRVVKKAAKAQEEAATPAETEKEAAAVPSEAAVTPAAAEKEEAEVPKEAETKPKPVSGAVVQKTEPALKEVTPIKRSGLRIKKKNRPSAEETAQVSKETTKLSSYGKLGADVLEELAQKKRAKKAAKGTPTQRKTSGTSLDIFGGGMSDVSMDYDDDEVVLLDLSEATQDKPKLPEEPQRPREKKPVGRGGGQKKPGGNRPRQVARKKRRKYTKEKGAEEVVTHVEIPEDIRVYEFAEKINHPISDVIKVLFNLGMMVTKNDFLGKDEIEILAEEFEVEVTTIDPTNAFNYEEEYVEAESEEHLEERPPVITIMGHVDHGKTSLLDAIRNARVAHGEAGGITQHIGAYTVEQKNKKITFIDTPGHAAFSAMRERGAQATDIVIIVVAADDGVKPQTIEAIKHAKASEAPIIVAVNKMDKEGANPDMVKAQMAEQDVSPIDWGGDVEFVPVSAKSGMGIDDLLDNILLTAEVMELTANPDAAAKAVVVESSVEKGRGPVGTVIVQNGTLRVGDNVVCGKAFGRVRSLINDQGQQIKVLGPSETAVVVGLNEVPAAGDVMIAMASDKEAREYAQKRAEYERQKELSASTKTSLDELTALIAEGKLKSLKVILKTDVHGSLEAIRTSLLALRNEEVKVDIISSGVGGITENDVELANSSENSVLLGFNVRPTGAVKALAKQRGVDIRTYTIIYQLLDDITGMLTGMMAPKFSEEHSGQADVREVFKIPKGMVAGCVVVDGKLVRGGLVRVIRDGVVIHEGDLTSLKRFKDDVKEVGNGYECGVVLNGYDDVQVGDVIETFTRVEQKVEL